MATHTRARPMRTHALGGSCNKAWAASDIAGGMTWILVPGGTGSLAPGPARALADRYQVRRDAPRQTVAAQIEHL